MDDTYVIYLISCYLGNPLYQGKILSQLSSKGLIVGIATRELGLSIGGVFPLFHCHVKAASSTPGL